MKLVRVMISKLLLLVRWADVTTFRKYQVNNIIQPQDKFTYVNSFSAVKAKLNFGESIMNHDEDIFHDIKIALTSQIISRCGQTLLLIMQKLSYVQ